MPHLNRDGVNIYYEEHGQGDPVLLSHGYSATSQMWKQQHEAIGAKYRLISWDMRGHGRSDSPEDQSLYSEAHTADDMAAVLDACAVRQAVIGGLSLGGYMSLGFYLKHPARTKALMLFDCGPGYRNPKGREGWNETAFARAKNFEEKGLDALGGSAEVRVSQHTSAAGLAKAARGMLAQFDSRVMECLPEIKVPTLVLVGANDTPFLAASEYMGKKIPGARTVVIPDAGHASNIDQPAAFNEAVLDFLESVK
jgi:pimeloyl-ACP methyl ester carboxylesterase